MITTIPATALPSDAATAPVDDWSRDLTTQSGYAFHVRPADASDETGLAAFFTHVTPEDLRFRFLSAIKTVGKDQIERLTHLDHRGTENFLVFDALHGTMVATGMLAADAALETAEVAIVIHRDFKHRGIGWTLLEHITAFARSRGIKTIESLESRDNHQAIQLEREMGFELVTCPGDPSSVIVRHTLN
ncbi:GNAT family N-acetyltransferase [Sphingomonas montana]|uniref:GNAT family N-acetyltransferase n=1 Tax=Sphingomonas montana TaxID=1843236 RepID=UPI00096F813F|nr:GNAT family N-acetyltransferase [Sphingomonas montana]